MAIPAGVGVIKNLLSDLAGVICDGAKAGCSFKLATAAGTAVQSALFSLHGIVAAPPRANHEKHGQISTKGMIDTDQTILQIMIDKKLTDMPAKHVTGNAGVPPAINNPNDSMIARPEMPRLH